MNEKRIGQAIAKERIARHMTPNALAEKLMVDAKTVIAWETGDVAPTVGDLAAICEALELKEDFFT
ncbi:MAG: helix-turn-helix transcriptional regulator, partial [Oscillospiraceae bacterium]|nr:helix-turn-helix transcriptional regulator [Oscillospiraceae bacterium]